MADPARPPNDRRSYWNERFSAEPSHYGDAPNQFVAAVAGAFRAGRALDLACGQGRNAVWLAEHGHEVTAIDFSAVAITQAKELAANRDVEVEFVLGDVETWDPPAAKFDLVLLSYLQLPPPLRKIAHAKAAEALAPGGRVLLVAHHLDNLTQGVGGPQYPEVLYDEAIVASDFAGLTVERNERVLRRVEHDGIDVDAIDLLFVARRDEQA